MAKNNFNFGKKCGFLVKVVNHSIYYKHYENSMLISCVKLDHALYSINYGNPSKRVNLSLSDGLLDVIVGELIGNGIPNANTVPLKEEIVVDDRLDVAVEIPGHLVVELHGNDVHQGASLIAESVL